MNRLLTGKAFARLDRMVGRGEQKRTILRRVRASGIFPIIGNDRSTSPHNVQGMDDLEGGSCGVFPDPTEHSPFWVWVGSSNLIAYCSGWIPCCRPCYRIHREVCILIQSAFGSPLHFEIQNAFDWVALWIEDRNINVHFIDVPTIDCTPWKEVHFIRVTSKELQVPFTRELSLFGLV